MRWPVSNLEKQDRCHVNKVSRILGIFRLMYFQPMGMMLPTHERRQGTPVRFFPVHVFIK